METKIAEFVCWVEEDHEPSEIVNQAKAWTWEFEAEHSLLRMANGRIALVRGGRDGIEFINRGDGDDCSLYVEIEGREVRIDRLLWHTHPRVTGPSDDDLKTLAILKQDDSWIYELGDPYGTRIAAKPRQGSD